MAEKKETEEHHSRHQKPHPHEGKKGKEIRITLPEISISGVNLSAITTVAAIALLVIVVFQAFQAYTLSQKLDALTAEATEQSRPAVIEMTTIEPECAECDSIASVVSSVEGAKANITKRLNLGPEDAHAQQLIAKYGIKRLPTVVVTGEIDKVNLASAANAGFTKTGDALIYSPQPPYVDANSGDVKGLVSLTYVNASSCLECQDLTPAVQQLRTQIKVTDFKVVDKDSEEGKKLVAEYEMARLPGILLSSDVNEYPIGAQLAQVGTVKKNKAIALGANAPYLNVSTGKITGITQIILLNDSSCAGCYDVTMHVPIVRRFQAYTGSIKVVDTASEEGKELISKYSITAVPTILMTGDVSPYEQLLGIWPTVGTTEKDGTLVFRTMSAISGSPYKDLTTGKLDPNIPPQ